MIEPSDSHGDKPLSRITVVAGGIGSGISVVCGIISAMGFPVYDCDSRARIIMDNDDNIKQSICREVCPDAVSACGRLDRKAIAEVVFADPKRLKTLNRLVHGAVLDDIRRWYDENDAPRLFVETALLYETRLDKMAGAVWCVEAPLDVRIRRVMARNGLDENHVRARILAQHNFVPDGALILNNDGIHPLLPAIINALEA